MGTSVGYQEYVSMPQLSIHAGSRMGSRHISYDDVLAVMSYGKTHYVRGAIIFALGHREAELCRNDGIHADRIEGLQVVCAQDDHTVITVYRNNDFSSLRRRKHR